MHIAKGLEFRAVAVVACDDEVIPLQERIGAVADDADQPEWVHERNQEYAERYAIPYVRDVEQAVRQHCPDVAIVRARTRRSHASWNTGSSSSRSTGPKQVIPPMS